MGQSLWGNNNVSPLGNMNTCARTPPNLVQNTSNLPFTTGRFGGPSSTGQNSSIFSDSAYNGTHLSSSIFSNQSYSEGFSGYKPKLSSERESQASIFDKKETNPSSSDSHLPGLTSNPIDHSFFNGIFGNNNSSMSHGNTGLQMNENGLQMNENARATNQPPVLQPIGRNYAGNTIATAAAPGVTH
jgi:hypothetical protein